MMRARTGIVGLAAAAALALGCASTQAPARESTDYVGAGAGTASAMATGTCADPKSAPAVATPPAPSCANLELTRYSALLVIGPHPDDEALGFGGLAATYHALGKPVSVIVTTDGDAYCDACRLWKSSSTTGAVCSASEL